MEKEVKIKDKNLSLALTKALIENGSKDITDFENTNNIFSKNELSEITKLDLKNTGIKSLDGLEYCTNLTSLSISSPNIDEIRSEEDLEVYLEQKNNIKDYSLIEKLELLESLTIRNESLKELNLASLNKITELELEGNTELLDIKGLNELDQIKKLVILEKSLQRELDLDLILESDTLTELVFDVDMYPLLVEKYPDLKEKLEESNEKGLITSFQMKRLGLETQEKSIEELEAKDKKTDYILSNIIDPSYNEIERVAAVYTFLTKQEIYNIESKDLNTENETSKQEQFSEYEDIEEYPYLMSELLRKAGVKTKVIPSSMDKDSNALDFTEAHEVVRAYIDNEWYYFDPIKDGEKKEFKHFYKTRDEFSETHSISDNENDIRSPEEKRYNNFELSGVIGKVSSDIERKDEGPRLKDGRIAEVGAKGKNTQDINTDKIEQKKSDTDKDTNNLDSKDKPIGEYTVETLDEFENRKKRIIKQIKDMAKSLGIDIQDLNESMKGIEQAQNAIELETRKKEAKDEIEAEDEKQKDDNEQEDDDKEQEEDGHDQGRIL